MNGARVHLIAEGQTELGFAKHVLAEYLALRGTFVTTQLVLNKAVRRGPDYRGGMFGYAAPRRDIETSLRHDTGRYVTTLFDYYRLPSDFPGMGTRPNGTGAARVAHVEAAMAADVADRRYVPYVQVHEFEALLFSDVGVLDEALGLYGYSRRRALQQIVDGVETPEEINDGPRTAPSKRLIDLYPAYDKVLFGEDVCRQIGVDAIRAACPRFDAWVERLAGLPPL